MMEILFAFLTSCAFALPFEILNTGEIAVRMPERTLIEKITAFLPVWGERMFPGAILLFILFLLLYRMLLKRIRNKGFSIAALAAGCLFSVFLIAGECAAGTGDLRPLFSNMPQCLMTALKFSGFCTLFYTAVRAGFDAVDNCREDAPSRGRVYQAVFENHAFLLPLLIILICRLPYVIAFYPGFVPSDGLKQLNNFFGSGNFTDHHPAFSTMLMGWAMMLGRDLGSDNLGIFLFTGTQMFISAAVMAACFPLFRDLRTPAWLRVLALIDFALLPVWPNYTYSLLKDSLYMVLILLFVIQMIRIIQDADGFCGKPGNLLLMIASLSLMMLFRHEGQIIGGMIFLTLFLLPKVRKQWKRLLPVILIPVLVINVFNRVIRPRLNIPDGPIREALCMPIRQTSAIVTEKEDSLTDEESAVLHEVFSYKKIPEAYAGSFSNADELKDKFDPRASVDDVMRYMKVWLQLGLKNPLTYINVFLCSNNGYYDPFLSAYRDIYGWFGIEQASYVNKGLFDIHYSARMAWLRSALINYADSMPGLPLTSLFYSLGSNAWILIFCFAFLLYRKKFDRIIPLLPGLATFLVIQTSAINGFFRYMLPIMIMLPLTLSWTMYHGQNHQINYSEKVSQDA